MQNLLFYSSFLIFSFTQNAFAKTVQYELSASQQSVNLSGKRKIDFAISLNNQIPAPTLSFTEGDEAEIKVINNLDQELSIHWHGILLPPEMDGVPYVTTAPIKAGKSFTFKFKIRQNGTYWYHSHTGLQEQKGVYGAIVIHPQKQKIKVDKDVTVVLSDWSDENPDQILKNLRKDGDYYLYKKGTMRSWYGAISQGEGALGRFLYNEWTRMGGMDLSDVGYDAFLINGMRDGQLVEGHPGERVRLRIINAGASSYFFVSLANLPFTVVSADGIDIEPLNAKELLLGMAETYDIVFTIPEHKNFELKATAQDGTGTASGWIGMGEKVFALNKPKPDQYASMEHANHGSAHATDQKMSHDEHSMNHEANTSDKEQPQTDHKNHSPPSEHTQHNTHQQSDAVAVNQFAHLPTLESLTVDDIKSRETTLFDANTPVHDVKLVLGGDMSRYIWFINGKTIQEDRNIIIKENDVVRFTLENQTMMHHPMHLHGHFFRVVNKFKEKSPLKHTVDVPPHQTRTIEFLANEPGEWMLHCHNLYHLKTGMARVVKYSSFTPKPEIAKWQKDDPHNHDHWYNYGLLETSSNHAQGYFSISQTWNQFEARVETANIQNKQFAFEGRNWDYEVDLFYRRWFNRYFNVIAGGTNYGEESRAVIGVGYLLPFLIRTNVLINSSGKIRIDADKRFQWTKTIFTDVEYSLRPNQNGAHESELEVSLMYSPKWSWAAGLMLTNDSLGGGLEIQF